MGAGDLSFGEGPNAVIEEQFCERDGRFLGLLLQARKVFAAGGQLDLAPVLRGDDGGLGDEHVITRFKGGIADFDAFRAGDKLHSGAQGLQRETSGGGLFVSLLQRLELLVGNLGQSGKFSPKVVERLGAGLGVGKRLLQSEL